MAKEIIFSTFDILKSALKFDGETTAYNASCTGRIQHELEVITAQKSCGEVTIDESVKGAGNGSGAIDMYLDIAAYRKIYAYQNEGLKEGVHSYGRNSLHKKFAYSAIVSDENGKKKYIAYPCVVASGGPTMEVTHGQTEINAPSTEVSFLPDANGQCYYELLEEEVASSGITEEQWLSNWSLALVTIVSG